MAVKRKLAVKTLAEKCKALKDLEKGTSNKEVDEFWFWLFLDFKTFTISNFHITYIRYLEHSLSRTFAMSNFFVGPVRVRDNERRLYTFFAERNNKLSNKLGKFYISLKVLGQKCDVEIYILNSLYQIDLKELEIVGMRITLN